MSYLQAMRLYRGSASPDWSSVSRTQVSGLNITVNAAHNAYVDIFLCGDAPDLAQMNEDGETIVSEDEASSSAARNGVGFLVGTAAFVAAVL